MQINMTKKVPVEAKELRLFIKVADSFSAGLHDQDGAEIKDYEGYVPGFMPGDHFGDYLILNIDIDTGQITNWRTPTAEEIEAFINNNEDD